MMMPRKRRVLVVAMGVTGAAAVALLWWARGGQDWGRVERRDLVVTIDVEGERRRFKFQLKHAVGALSNDEIDNILQVVSVYLNADVFIIPGNAGEPSTALPSAEK